MRFVGDPVAFVVAETLNQAKDGAELIAVEYEELPAVIGAEAAQASGAPAVWANNPGNEAFTREAGNRQAVESAFARAAQAGYPNGREPIKTAPPPREPPGHGGDAVALACRYDRRRRCAAPALESSR